MPCHTGINAVSRAAPVFLWLQGVTDGGGWPRVLVAVTCCGTVEGHPESTSSSSDSWSPCPKRSNGLAPSFRVSWYLTAFPYVLTYSEVHKSIHGNLSCKDGLVA